MRGQVRLVFSVALLLSMMVPALQAQRHGRKRHAKAVKTTTATKAPTPDIPQIVNNNGLQQFFVHGEPFLMLAGELGNSSAGTAAQADTILPRLAQLHFNTVLMPVSWEEIEPTEGKYDFSVLDHWIGVARQQHLHLVLLWFGSWKNGYSEYAPAWVRSDPQRFPRAISMTGQQTEILSTFGKATLAADSSAFAALMQHLQATDAQQRTVLMVQVENEIGYFGPGGRDRSPAANQLFDKPVPPTLLVSLEGNRGQLFPELADDYNPEGKTWAQVFGPSADEAFMAWNYARYVDQVAAAGEKQYALPMYLNAQLPAPGERAGSYPSGGPHPSMQAIYQAVAPHITFYAPDIYWPNFEQWIERYHRTGNPAFVPEARLDVAAFNALYLFGEKDGFGFSAFDVDALPVTSDTPADTAADGPTLPEVYGVLAPLQSTILAAQQSGQIRALVLHANSWRPTQDVALGGYLFRAQLARSWPAMKLGEQNGGMMVIQQAANQFLVVGAGLTVNFERDPDTDDQLVGIASVDQMAWQDGKWVVAEHLNGDQTNQGRQLLMATHAIHVYQVKLFSYPRASSAPTAAPAAHNGDDTKS